MKAVQRLIGRLASLNRFVSKLAERSLPFLEVLKGTYPFQWGEKQQEAFEELKKYLIHLTTLSPPDKGTNLLVYVSTAPLVVSAVLVQERSKDGKKEQIPVYFILEALSAPKANYSEIEKIIYAVVMASRKLQHYFQAHSITVPSSHPIKDVLQNIEASGRIGKWATELSSTALTSYTDLR